MSSINYVLKQGSKYCNSTQDAGLFEAHTFNHATRFATEDEAIKEGDRLDAVVICIARLIDGGWGKF